EIEGQKPGYRQQFLQLPVDRTIDRVSFFQRLLHGQEDLYQYIPIGGYEIKGDSLIVQKFVFAGVYERTVYPLPQTDYHITNNTYYIGTDKYGRDILSRLIVGVRVSLGVGLVTVIISLSIGVLLGALAGYFRG